MDGARRRFVVPTQGGRHGIPGPADGGRPASVPSAHPTSSDGEQRFRALFDHAPVGVALSEPGGRFTDVNHALRELLDGTGIDPDSDGPGDLARHAPSGSGEALTWREGLADVCAARAPVVRAELPVAPAGAPPRWVQATTALVVLGDRRYLLTHLEDATGRRLAAQRLLRRAQRDDLTGLATRALLADRLAAAHDRDGRTGLSTGALYVSLDGFRRLNDRFGHEVGDEVLVAVGRRLTAALRTGDTAGRVGGDEFVVLAGDVPDAPALTEVAQRLTAAVGEPLELAGHRVVVAASVGASLARPGEALEAVLRRADDAMFAVKRARRATARVDVDALELTLRPDVVATRPDEPGPQERRREPGRRA